MITPAELEHFLREQIPLSRAMGVQVAVCDERQLVLTAPLAPNRNHLQTAFGGSLHTLATLSGYGLLWRLLGEPQAHIVIRESTIRYDRPVRGDLRAICRAPEADELARFREDFASKGRARLTLHARIEEDGRVAVDFRGVFIARR